MDRRGFTGAAGVNTGAAGMSTGAAGMNTGATSVRRHGSTGAFGGLMGRTGAALVGGARLLATLVSSKSLCIGIGDQPDGGEGKIKAHFRRS